LIEFGHLVLEKKIFKKNFSVFLSPLVEGLSPSFDET
jgi:hypothetical protein